MTTARGSNWTGRAPVREDAGALFFERRGRAARPLACDDPAVSKEPIKLRWPLDHYFSPVPNTRRLALRRFRLRVWPPEPHPTPGIEWRGDAQLALCKTFAEQEPLAFPPEPTGDEQEYFRSNQLYPALDAWILQALLRDLRPRRLIEVGAGYSSLVAARVNRELLDGRMRFTSIDPHPAPFVRDLVPGLSDLRAEEVQDSPLSLFAELDAGDVLFVDTSHTVKTDGEVPWIYNQILPALRPGVVVHLHDVFLPGDYPQDWVLEGRAWNELYLVRAFLVFNAGFEILFGAQWMMQNHWDALAEAFPDLTRDESRLASSLWIRRVGPDREDM
jgi:predicted O-methyltransferase YrrM